MDQYSIIKRRIVQWYPGKFGYKSFYQLQRWNEVYQHWYSEHDAILLEFIESHCLIKGIEFKSIPVIEIGKDE